MKDNYDFSKGVKNPYINQLKRGYSVTVHYVFTQNDNAGESAGKKMETNEQHPHNQA